MLEVTVTRNQHQATVQLPNAEKLTPKSARSAVAIAFGGFTGTVFDNAGNIYRITEKSARKLNPADFGY